MANTEDKPPAEDLAENKSPVKDLNEDKPTVKDLAEKSETVPEEEGKKKRKKKKKVKKSLSKPDFQKLTVRILICSVIVLAEVGVSYTIVTKLLSPKNKEVTDETVDSEELEGAQVLSQNGGRQSKPARRVVQGSQDDYGAIGGLFTLDDLVVNPAYTSGKRFFITSIALIVESKEMEDLLREREPIVKDRIISLLSEKSFGWLAANSNRETLRQELLVAVEDIVRYSGGMRVYFTKYVLQ